MKDYNAKNKIFELYCDLRQAFHDEDYKYYERNYHRYDAIGEFIKNNTYCYGYYKLTKNQKGFLDFIIIFSLICGLMSITGSILTLVGVVSSDTHIYYNITSLIITSICVLYLLIYKFVRIYKNGKLRNKDKVY